MVAAVKCARVLGTGIIVVDGYEVRVLRSSEGIRGFVVFKALFCSDFFLASEFMGVLTAC